MVGAPGDFLGKRAQVQRGGGGGGSMKELWPLENALMRRLQENLHNRGKTTKQEDAHKDSDRPNLSSHC